MNLPDIESRITKTHSFLKDGINSKLQVAASDGGLSELEQAYKIAHEEPTLPFPWPEITSYRLAHLLMRSASQNDELERVEQLFAEAERHGNNLLGPLPRLYRLAVRMRLGYGDQAFFEGTIQAFRNTNDRLAPDEPKPIHKPWLQMPWINQLELLAYVGGFDYKPLHGLNPGLKNPFDDLKLGNGFRIIGSGDQLAQILMPQAIALKQAQEMLGDKGLVLVWKEKERQLWCYKSSNPFPIPVWSGLLALLLYKKSLCRETLNRHADTDDNLRQKIRRIKKFLSDETGCADVFIETRHNLQLKPSLPMLGVISQVQLRKFEKCYLG